MEHAPFINTQSMEHERTLQELADAKAEIAHKDEQIEQNKDLLAEMTESRDQQKQQRNEIQTQLDAANINISELRASESELKEQAASSQVEVNDLNTALVEATSLVSELEVEKNHFGDYIELKDSEIEKLRGDAVETSNYIRKGCQELKDFLELTEKLYNRLHKAEKRLEGALGWDDQLMRSAAQILARWNVPVKTYFRDVISTEAEVHDLVIVGRQAGYSAINRAETGHVYEVSADDSALEQLIDEILGAADTGGDVSGVEGSASENAEVEQPKAKSQKTSETASIFAAAAGIDLSSSSASSTAKGKQREERTPAFGQEGSRIFSFSPSEDAVRAEQTPRHPDAEGTSPSFNFTSTGAFDFAASTAKSNQKEVLTPIFGAEGSNQFSFSPRDFASTFGGSSGSSAGAPQSPEDRGEDKEKHRSTDKATNDPLFSAETFAKFDSGPSGRTFDFGNISFPTMDASEGQAEPSRSSTSSEAVVAWEDGDYNHLYDIEEDYIPPAERLTVVDQAGVEPASTADTNQGEDADADSTGVPRITITPAWAFENKVEVGNSDILGRNGFNVAALSRIAGSVCPVVQEDLEAGSHQGGNLEGVNHGVESLCERLLPREGHYPALQRQLGSKASSGGVGVGLRRRSFRSARRVLKPKMAWKRISR